MTNGAKAMMIASDKEDYPSAYAAAIQMAEWKDETNPPCMACDRCFTITKLCDGCRWIGVRRNTETTDRYERQ